MMSGKRNSDLSVHLRNYAIKWMIAPNYFRANSMTGYQTRKGAKRSGHTMKLKQGNNIALERTAATVAIGLYILCMYWPNLRPWFCYYIGNTTLCFNDMRKQKKTILRRLNGPPIVCGGPVFGSCFVMHYLVSFLVLQSSWRGRESWFLYSKVVFLMACDCWCYVALLHGVMV